MTLSLSAIVCLYTLYIQRVLVFDTRWGGLQVIKDFLGGGNFVGRGQQTIIRGGNVFGGRHDKFLGGGNNLLLGRGEIQQRCLGGIGGE